MESFSPLISVTKQIAFESEYNSIIQTDKQTSNFNNNNNPFNSLTNTQTNTQSNTQTNTNNNNNKLILYNIKTNKKIIRLLIENPLNNELNNMSQTLNTTFITYVPTQPGTYNTKLIIYSLINPLDIRIYELKMNILMYETKQTLHFRGACRTKLMQDIIIMNDSLIEDWNILTQLNGKGFNVTPKLLKIRKLSVVKCSEV